MPKHFMPHLERMKGSGGRQIVSKHSKDSKQSECEVYIWRCEFRNWKQRAAKSFKKDIRSFEESEEESLDGESASRCEATL